MSKMFSKLLGYIKLPKKSAVNVGGKNIIRRQAAIVPPFNLAVKSLEAVVAIMTCLACLTLGTVVLIDESARNWQSQISREVTIQIKPASDFDIENALELARSLALEFEGVKNARIISQAETNTLLEPWLGSGLDLSILPIPRLVVVTIDEINPPNFAALGETITGTIENATFDDHRAWVFRLVSMAWSFTLTGLTILGLVIVALIMTVVFATRGAMSGNNDSVEVLYFVGAEQRFIARQFERQFSWIGLKGALIGGGLALIIFYILSSWMQTDFAAIKSEQIEFLFGKFEMGFKTYIGIGVILFIVAILTALTTRITVLATLRDIDERRSDPSIKP